MKIGMADTWEGLYGIIHETAHDINDDQIRKIADWVNSQRADEIESLTAANERLRKALEEAILWGEFMDLCEKWRKVLEETK